MGNMGAPHGKLAEAIFYSQPHDDFHDPLLLLPPLLSVPTSKKILCRNNVGSSTNARIRFWKSHMRISHLITDDNWLFLTEKFQTLNDDSGSGDIGFGDIEKALGLIGIIIEKSELNIALLKYEHIEERLSKLEFEELYLTLRAEKDIDHSKQT
ncbi:unnamed protein product [Didymodactylos carnosus]|uniref:Uncharacterized protein n=1 Tax=Didymodactylos carnosus TaxID=1234261 RepID=A0A815WSL3_9BILA|nr:unnamed protein product [Didymodactylos carnosus]CAF1548025.1 unnamed protein product [Didymodactylos carnosus]CAF4300057.1 unnamed protein product [Didymodactylos carnosus]CAF4408834.1 unnamed protein product [Didymodactylos carnosus]